MYNSEVMLLRFVTSAGHGFALTFQFMSTMKHAITKDQLDSCLDAHSVLELAMNKT